MTSTNHESNSSRKPAATRSTPTWIYPDELVYKVGSRTSEQWVLEFIGGFSTLQKTIESFVGGFIRQSSPFIGKKIEKNHLRRLTDEERWDYVKALAREGDYQGSLMHTASNAFWRCKRIRDFVSHHPRMLLLYGEDGNVFYDVPHKQWRYLKVDPLTPETFRKLATECRWLEAFVRHLTYLSGFPFISAHVPINTAGEPQPQYVEVMEPPPLPVSDDWEASGLTRNIEGPTA